MFTARTLHRAYPLCFGQRPSNSHRRNSSGTKNCPRGLGWPSSSEPTPHEILGIGRGVAYSKANFNHLVKIYHPDASYSELETKHLSPAVRLERYRLIVAAHNLLSDPRKRHGYESHNLGWIYPSSSTTQTPMKSDEWSNSSTQDSSHSPLSPLSQQPIYTSNAAFALMLVTLSMLGAVLQYRRMARTRREAKRLEVLLSDALQEEIRAWASILQGQSRDDRILAFLARRHGVPQQLRDWEIAHSGKAR